MTTRDRERSAIRWESSPLQRLPRRTMHRSPRRALPRRTRGARGRMFHPAHVERRTPAVEALSRSQRGSYGRATSISRRISWSSSSFPARTIFHTGAKEPSPHGELTQISREANGPSRSSPCGGSCHRPTSTTRSAGLSTPYPAETLPSTRVKVIVEPLVSFRASTNEYQLEFCPRTALPDTFISTACQATGPEMPEVLTPRDAQAVTGRIRITATALRPFIDQPLVARRVPYLSLKSPNSHWPIRPMTGGSRTPGRQRARVSGQPNNGAS